MIEEKNTVVTTLFTAKNHNIILKDKYIVNNIKKLDKLVRKQPLVTTLEVLLLFGVIDNDSVLCLTDYLETENGKLIKNLHVISSRLHNAEAQTIIDCITNIPHQLHGLSFWENKLSGDLSFLTKIGRLKETLKYLNLGENNLSGNLTYIGNVVNQCLLLRELHLYSANLNDQDMKELCLLIQNHPNLKQLSLHCNPKITNESFEYLDKLLQHNKQLKQITLLKTSIDIDLIEALQDKYDEVNITYTINYSPPPRLTLNL